MLKRFQAEIGKRILKLPHSHNYVPVNSCGAQICDDDAFLAKSVVTAVESVIL